MRNDATVSGAIVLHCVLKSHPDQSHHIVPAEVEPADCLSRIAARKIAVNGDLAVLRLLIPLFAHRRERRSHLAAWELNVTSDIVSSLVQQIDAPVNVGNRTDFT